MNKLEEDKKWYAGLLSEAEPLAKKILAPCDGLNSKDVTVAAILAAVIAAKQSDMPEDLFMFSVSEAFEMVKVVKK